MIIKWGLAFFIVYSVVLVTLRYLNPSSAHSAEFFRIGTEISARESDIELSRQKIKNSSLKYKIKLASNSYYSNYSKNSEYFFQFEGKIPLIRENATLLMLVRNWELDGALKSMRSLEDRFNNMYRYNWTFLNDVEFSEDFIEATSLMASGKTEYGLIPSEDWDRPSWINESRFLDNLNKSEVNGVLYGNSKSYRNMCRFNSGYFFKQKLLDKYDYYFRVEPDVEYFCDFQYDPFKVMREQRKKYGFVISLYEYENTIPSLWNVTKQFMEKYPQHLHPNNSYKFITDIEPIGPTQLTFDLHSEYNLCHFWSNFEIGDLNFYRSKAYGDYFNHLEKAGGFYYERWGDAPVHSIGAALLLDKDEIHHFEDLGYTHVPYHTCPHGTLLRYAKRCTCDPAEEANIDVKLHSCLPKWWKYGGGKNFLNKF